MQFTTKIPIPKSNHPIDYDSKIISLGSCFAVNIAEKFNYFKFQNSVNPFGILFHPLAINEVVRRAVEEDFFKESELFFHNERWHCFDVHSDMSHSNKGDLLLNLNQRLADLKSQIKAASHLLITYGTAWVYKEKTSQKIVANCHKVPQAQFEKELLSATVIEAAIVDTVNLLLKVNPKLNVVLTVSPVRHLKDGFVQNQQSKANLIIGIHQTIQQLATNSRQPTTYFPSYEIMMDELRDYRFYAEDMIHPNQTAVDYIWERFAATSIATESLTIMNEVESIQKALAHRPFHSDAKSHQKFLMQLNQRISQLQEKVPNISF
jgi:lysophospholipase L1-like esterase